MTHILITDLREIRYMAYVPEEPKVIDFKSGRGFEYTKHEIAWIKYRSDLEKAKRESVLFEDQGAAQMELRKVHSDGNLLWSPEPGIYQVPVEVEVVEIPEEDSGVDGSGPPYAKVDFKKVARIVQPKEPKPESHGRAHNDTIVTVERKFKYSLYD